VVPENPGAAMVVVIGGKNLVSFGISQGIVPMIHTYSYLTSFMIVSPLMSKAQPQDNY
jgi:hypothetical protein